jgi:hypothetical protein
MGFERGKSIASWQVLPEIGMKTARHIDWVGVDVVETVEDAQEYFFCICQDCEENNRSYSPFEFLAKEINDTEISEELWQAFDDGVRAGFEKDWEERKSYYDGCSND